MNPVFSPNKKMTYIKNRKYIIVTSKRLTLWVVPQKNTAEKQSNCMKIHDALGIYSSSISSVRHNNLFLARWLCSNSIAIFAVVCYWALWSCLTLAVTEASLVWISPSWFTIPNWTVGDSLVGVVTHDGAETRKPATGTTFWCCSILPARNYVLLWSHIDIDWLWNHTDVEWILIHSTSVQYNFFKWF